MGTNSSGIPRRALADGIISPNKLHDALRNQSYFHEVGNYQPMLTAVGGVGDPPGADDSEFLAHFKSQPLLGHCIGAATILGPTINPTTGKLALQLDAVDTEGVEYAFDVGENAGSGPLVYTVGTTGPLIIQAKFVIADVSEIPECAVGFRKNQAFQAAIDDYTDMCVLNVQAGTVNHEVILNDDPTVAVDTGKTWGDGEEHEIKVLLGIAQGPGSASHEGKARVFFDGEEVGAQFTFDAADVLVPFIHILQGTAGSAVELTDLAVAHPVDVDDFLIM